MLGSWISSYLDDLRLLIACITAGFNAVIMYASQGSVTAHSPAFSTTWLMWSVVEYLLGESACPHRCLDSCLALIFLLLLERGSALLGLH